MTKREFFLDIVLLVSWTLHLLLNLVLIIFLGIQFSYIIWICIDTFAINYQINKCISLYIINPYKLYKKCKDSVERIEMLYRVQKEESSADEINYLREDLMEQCEKIIIYINPLKENIISPTTTTPIITNKSQTILEKTILASNILLL